MLRSAVRAITTATIMIAAARTAAAQGTAFALASDPDGTQQLVQFNPSAPGTVVTVGATGVRLTGIDFRPATDELYGYDGDKLYLVSATTGAATVAFDVANVSGNVGFDFNPTVDRIRLVGASGANFRLNPLTGGSTVDGAYMFAMGDVNFGRVPVFIAVAYTNSDRDPATGTTFFAIDPTLGQLIRVTSPNGGNVSTVGSLGLGALSSITGFDILTIGTSNTAFFAGTSQGSMVSQLYTVNLDTGAATLVGNIGAMGGIEGLALTAVPEPSSWALMATGLLGLGAVTRRSRRNAVG